MHGVVKFYLDEKNFGFITGEDHKDYFVHKSNVKKAGSLYVGEKVVFYVIETEKGLMAVDVNERG